MWKANDTVRWTSREPRGKQTTSIPLSSSLTLPFHRHKNHPQLGQGTRRTRSDKDQSSLEGRDLSQGKTLKLPSGQCHLETIEMLCKLQRAGESHHKGLSFYGPKAGVTNSWRRHIKPILGSQVQRTQEAGWPAQLSVLKPLLLSFSPSLPSSPSLFLSFPLITH